MKKAIFGVIFALSCLSAAFAADKNTRVLVIALDGIRSDGMVKASTPNMDATRKESRRTWNARNVVPSGTLPNWTSHLTGSGPERHGANNNRWTLANVELRPAVCDADGYYPSVFKVLKDQVPGIKTAYYWDWKPLINTLNPKYMDEAVFAEGEDWPASCGRALDFMVRNASAPTFVFLYEVGTDHAGHHHGWMSDEYIKSIEDVDKAVGDLVDGMKKAGIYDDTFILIMTDHGGINFGHGKFSHFEMDIPWAIKGPGIEPGILEEVYFTVNTAPLIAGIFGAKAPYCWAGKAPESLFAPVSESTMRLTLDDRILRCRQQAELMRGRSDENVPGSWKQKAVKTFEKSIDKAEKSGRGADLGKMKSAFRSLVAAEDKALSSGHVPFRSGSYYRIRNAAPKFDEAPVWMFEDEKGVLRWSVEGEADADCFLWKVVAVEGGITLQNKASGRYAGTSAWGEDRPAAVTTTEAPCVYDFSWIFWEDPTHIALRSADSRSAAAQPTTASSTTAAV